jgi:hypothetical protein
MGRKSESETWGIALSIDIHTRPGSISWVLQAILYMMSSRQKSSAPPEDPQQELEDEEAFSGAGEKDEAMEEVGDQDEYS